jgi:RNA polymerase sigma-32 factor
MRSLKMKDPRKNMQAAAPKKAKVISNDARQMGKRRPGPSAHADPLRPEQDLADAALIIDLVEKGSLKTATHENEGVPPAPIPITSGRHPRLSAEQELELARRVRQFGDIDARNALVMSNIGLVHLIANQFQRPSLRYEDLLQEGTIGLIRATETFEPSRSIRFSTYSVYWIRAKIQRLIEKIEKDDVPRISGAQFRVSPSGKKVRPRARKVSIDRPIEGDESRTLSDILPSSSDDPEGVALKQEKAQMVKQILQTVVEELRDPRLNTLIELRLLADEPLTLTDVGEKLHLSREGARLLESRMLKVARQRLAEWHLDSHDK